MIQLVIGGVRSGKTRHAMALAEALSTSPIYVATAEVRDAEFQRRVARHRQERGEHWRLYEESLSFRKLPLDNEVVVFDCATLWLSRLFEEYAGDSDACLSHVSKELDCLQQMQGTFIWVSNELGQGVHAESEMARRFVDLQGWGNQRLASAADRVDWVVAGIPVTIKPKGGG